MKATGEALGIVQERLEDGIVHEDVKAEFYNITCGNIAEFRARIQQGFLVIDAHFPREGEFDVRGVKERHAKVTFLNGLHFRHLKFDYHFKFSPTTNQKVPAIEDFFQINCFPSVEGDRFQGELGLTQDFQFRGGGNVEVVILAHGQHAWQAGEPIPSPRPTIAYPPNEQDTPVRIREGIRGIERIAVVDHFPGAGRELVVREGSNGSDDFTTGTNYKTI